jgi:hypothetical protein
VPRRGACARLLHFGARSPIDERITGKSAQLDGDPAKNSIRPVPSLLPLLPIQLLLTNLIHDIAQAGLPFDRVDRDVVARLVHWDIGLIERSMLVIGPIRTLFDVLTFGVLLLLFRATETQFRTGWFIESLVC